GHSWPVILMRASRPFAMTPVGANGENAPEFAPQHTHTVMRKALMPILPATAMATGANSAVVAMLPAPIVERPAARKKNMTGIMPTFPRASLMLRRASLSSVPFTLARLKRSVTPTRMRNRFVGNPAATSATFIPPKNTPTIKAKAMPSTPTLISEIQLMMIATANATTERTANDMVRGFYQNRMAANYANYAKFDSRNWRNLRLKHVLESELQDAGI